MDHSNPFMGKLNWTDWTPQRWLHPSRCDCGCPGLEIESPCSWNRRPTLCTRPGAKTAKSPEGAPCFAKKNSMKPSAGRIILNFTGWMVFFVENWDNQPWTFNHKKHVLPPKTRASFKVSLQFWETFVQDWHADGLQIESRMANPRAGTICFIDGDILIGMLGEKACKPSKGWGYGEIEASNMSIWNDKPVCFLLG